MDVPCHVTSPSAAKALSARVAVIRVMPAASANCPVPAGAPIRRSVSSTPRELGRNRQDLWMGVSGGLLVGC